MRLSASLTVFQLTDLPRYRCKVDTSNLHMSMNYYARPDEPGVSSLIALMKTPHPLFPTDFLSDQHMQGLMTSLPQLEWEKPSLPHETQPPRTMKTEPEKKEKKKKQKRSFL